jgi:hypothetical protein
MNHQLSQQDLVFHTQFESCEFPVTDFDHRAHLRLAYVYLVEHDDDTAYQLMRESLQCFLRHAGVDISKYHETITRAWILAVRHFMKSTPQCLSADLFIDRNPDMLDTKIMLTHYSAETLFSDRARQQFVEPNLDPIPRYTDTTDPT